MSDPISAANQLYTFFKGLKSIKDFKDALMDEAALLGLKESINNLRGELFVWKEEVNALREKNKDLEEKLRTQKKVFKEGNMYFAREEDGSRTGPYCMQCWDEYKRLMNMHDEPDCWICRADIHKGNYKIVSKNKSFEERETF